MSFTLAHPAAALPLRRLLGAGGVASALFIGSIVPDFALFFPIPNPSYGSHSLAGLLWFSLPVGLVAYVLFHAFCRPVGVFVLPAALRERIPSSSSWIPDTPLWAVALSIVVGAATHVVWDSLTHRYAGPVIRWSMLRSTLFRFDGHSIHVYQLLQHVGTLVGLGILAWMTWRWCVAAPRTIDFEGWRPADNLRWPMLAVLVLAPTIAGCVSGWASIGNATHLRAAHDFLFYAAVSSMRALAAAWIGLGVVWRFFEWRARARE